jgi:hypothetical protein
LVKIFFKKKKGKNSICGPYDSSWPITTDLTLHSNTLWCPTTISSTACYQFTSQQIMYVYPSATNISIQYPAKAYPCETYFTYVSAPGFVMCRYNNSNSITYSGISYNTNLKQIYCLLSNFPVSNRKIISFYWNSPNPFDISNSIQIIQLYKGTISQSGNQVSLINVAKNLFFTFSSTIDPSFWPFIYCNSDSNNQNFITQTVDGKNFMCVVTSSVSTGISLDFINGSIYENISTNSINIPFLSLQSFVNLPNSGLTTSLITYNSYVSTYLILNDIVFNIDGVFSTPASSTAGLFKISLSSGVNINKIISLYWQNSVNSTDRVLISNSTYTFSFISKKKN